MKNAVNLEPQISARAAKQGALWSTFAQELYTKIFLS